MNATIPTSMFGKDHWSTFGYAECRIVDNSGRPQREHMRCDPARHPAHAHLGSTMGSPSPTRLKGGVECPSHDDWDCIDDLEAAGLLTTGGTGLFPTWALTNKGRRVAAELRAHKAKRGSFGDFTPSEDAIRDHPAD